MGLLENAGYPLAWDSEENKAAVQYVLKHGIEQFLALYSNYKGEVNKPFLWGDEVEYHLVHIDPVTKEAKLWLSADQPLKQLNTMEEDAKKSGAEIDGLWRPEFASFMIEGTPPKPYTYALESIAGTEKSLIDRYAMLKALLPPNVFPITLANFPRMGTVDPKTGQSDYTMPPGLPRGAVQHSLFVADNCLNPHPRFPTLVANIRKRRGKKVSIRIPLFIDERTKVDPFLNIDSNAQNKYITATQDEESDEHESDVSPPRKKQKPAPGVADDLKPHATQTMYYFAQYFDKEESKGIVARKHTQEQAEHPSIYMDSMAFGMGCNCLQTTFQARHIDQARHVYDQLAVLCPIMLALTASTPIHKGLLSEIDVRWMVISESVDCRMESELPRIMKSRYDSISTYISTRPADPFFAAMNDIKLCVDENVYKRLREAEIDHRLARHISHLFIRDPLVIYSGRLHQLEDARESDHFENIQSTNWQSMRFKPPPPKASGSDIGWRVEFRIMEVQMSPFENAAFTTFTILVARAIIAFDLDFYLPLTQVDNNIARAHARDALHRKKFFMQKNIGKLDILKEPSAVEYCEMSVDEILNGSDEHKFEGLIPIVKRYVDETKKTEHDGQPLEAQQRWVAAKKRVDAYCELLRRRANGSLKTTARYLRDMVLEHPTYNKDSKVTKEICFDMCKLASDMAAGKLFPDSLLPRSIVDMAGGPIC
ncbi:Glutamate--cysteine ligase [Diplonema papillatum]|nr:Glutamate--cysteine ligase [Diplonema papillatum]